MSTTKTFRLTHRVARGLLIATDTIATNSYWMVDSTHPAWRATVDRLGGVNRVSRGFTSWAECRSGASEFTGDMSIEKVFTAEGREMIDVAGFAEAGWEVNPDFEAVLVGYETRCFLPSANGRWKGTWTGHVGMYDDDRLVGVLAGKRCNPNFA